MTSFFAQIMEPGGGLKLIPFVRFVICLLFLLTVIGAFVGVARVHMVVLSFLSAGLLGSLHFFETELNKLRSARASQGGSKPVGAINTAGKSD